MLICLLALQTSKMPGAEYLNISPSFKAGADPIPSWRNPGVIAAGGVDGPGNYGKWIAQDPNDAQDQHDDMFLCLEANHTWVGNHWQRSIWIGTTLQWIYHCQSNRDEESKDKDTTQVEDSVKVHPSARHALQKPNHKDQAQTYRAYHELPHKSHSGTVNAMNARDPNDVQIEDHHLPYLKKIAWIRIGKKNCDPSSASMLLIFRLSMFKVPPILLTKKFKKITNHHLTNPRTTHTSWWFTPPPTVMLIDMTARAWVMLITDRTGSTQVMLSCRMEPRACTAVTIWPWGGFGFFQKPPKIWPPFRW